ncbi:MAG: diacylglycerol kinase family lipid kinase [Phyllobacteriaceae bacterium]|nr:diacylglycerol kinase family lipid kinase [Phyllobacteriaceae bacterium]
MSVLAIYNPVAGGGRAGREWPQIEPMLQRHFPALTVRATRGPGDASTLAAEAARSGIGLVIVCGGDGTISEVVDGLLRARAFEGAGAPKLGIIPDGTGSDLSKTLGFAGDLNSQVERIARGDFRRIDAGRLTFETDSGDAAVRHFVNIASLGLSGPTSRAVNAARAKRRFGAKLVFMFHTIRELLRYRFQEVRVTIDEAAPIEARIALVAIANGKFFGGGMMIAPQALIDDGVAEVVVFRGDNKLRLIRDINTLYTGEHVKLDVVTMLKGRKVRVEPVGDRALNSACLDIDGESPGRIPATFEILPGALEVAR